MGKTEENSCLQAIFSFPAMFSKAFFLRLVQKYDSCIKLEKKENRSDIPDINACHLDKLQRRLSECMFEDYPCYRTVQLMSSPWQLNSEETLEHLYLRLEMQLFYGAIVLFFQNSF